jgi:hypothetical protein
MGVETKFFVFVHKGADAKSPLAQQRKQHILSFIQATIKVRNQLQTHAAHSQR